MAVRIALTASLIALGLAACGGGGTSSSSAGGGSGGGGEGGTDGGGGTPPPSSKVDFRDEIVYQVLTDRFSNGDATNDGGRLDRAGDSLDPANPVGWHGGDFAGIEQKISDGYFQDLGFTAIWISPVVLQVPPPGNGGGVNSSEPFVGFHGYWADRFDQTEPHFGELDDLVALGEAADAAGIRLIIDVVVNHVGPGSQLLDQHPEWFRTGSGCGSDDVTLCLAGLPDFKQEVPAVSDFLLDTIDWLRSEVPSIDGLRMDTMKHVGDAFWAEFFAPGSPADPTEIWTVGEVFDGNVLKIAHYLDDVGSPSVFDFPLKFAIVDSLARGGTVRRIADVFAQDTVYADPTRLSTFLDNHDVVRFTSEAEAAGASAQEADRRLDMALTLLYTARGIPVVYYGTEIAMRGRGDSYALPIGESSREDMDFSRLASSSIDERLKALADLRQRFVALRRGVQRTLFAPADRCQPTSSSLDPAADFGDRLYVRGSFDGWANPPPESQRFVNLGSRQYEAAVELPAARHAFKVAAADWSPEFTNPDRDAQIGAPITLRADPGTGTNTQISIATSGCYLFSLDATSTTNPVLTVSGRASAAADPEVFAFARTMTGETSVVVVINNERAEVDLSQLAGGGIDVSGLLADGAAADASGLAVELDVSGGRLRGRVPPLSGVVLAAP
jgi:glycosidase